MISDHQEDDAALSALGLLDDDERARFERETAADADLRALAGGLRETAASLALAAGPRTLPPPAGAKARLLARVAGEKSHALPAGKEARSFWSTRVRWGIAAAAALIPFLAFLTGTRPPNGAEQRKDWHQQNELRRLRLLVPGLQTEVRRQELAIQRLDEALARQQAQASSLSQMALCALDPVPTAAGRGNVVVAWDAALREGKLIVTRLAPPGPGHDYQLWVIEEGHPEPISAGLVRVDAEGRATVDFKPADPGTAKVGAFALSLEQAGGSAKNQGPILLLGKP